jgi:hypothetical protein
MVDKFKWFGETVALLPHYPWYGIVAMVVWLPLTGYVTYLLTAGRPFVAQAPRMSRQALHTQAVELSNQILVFVTDRQRNEPQIDYKDWDRSTKEHINYSTETNNIFAERFGGRALAIRDEFERHQLKDRELDQFVEHPTNYIGMRIVGMRIAALAHSLPGGAP